MPALELLVILQLKQPQIKTQRRVTASVGELRVAAMTETSRLHILCSVFKRISNKRTGLSKVVRESEKPQSHPPQTLYEDSSAHVHGGVQKQRAISPDALDNGELS